LPVFKFSFFLHGKIADMSKKLVVANWKLNPSTLEEADRIIKIISRAKITGATLVVCPPAVFLGRFTSRKMSLSFGVQDIFYETAGAFTGEYSALMAKSTGARFAIVGHSERRAYGETNKIVAKKVEASLKAKLGTILCVGEKERDTHGHYLSYLKAQIDESLEGVSKNHIDGLIIAYEPLWTIGERSRGAMEARDLHETALFVRKVLHDYFGKKALSIPILYGGSVDSENARTLIIDGQVDGLLIGRESIKPEHFLKIARSVTGAKS